MISLHLKKPSSPPSTAPGRSFASHPPLYKTQTFLIGFFFSSTSSLPPRHYQVSYTLHRRPQHQVHSIHTACRVTLPVYPPAVSILLSTKASIPTPVLRTQAGCDTRIPTARPVVLFTPRRRRSNL
ncbi:hypothetical protein BDW66DRAFT_4002 [Aspergillus desertorum]